MFVWFCNDMIIASARFKSVLMTLQLDPARGVLVWMRMYVWPVWKEKTKEISLKCYSMSWKAVRNLPNVHIDLFLNLGLWCVPLPCFTLRYYTPFLCYKHPHDSHVSIVLNSCYMKPCHSGSFLDVFWRAGLQQRATCLKFDDTKLCFWPVTMLFHWIREETHSKGTLVYFVKLKIWSPLSITCKKKT